MFGSDEWGKHALECLRLEADCRQLGAETDRSYLKSHFIRMAAEWAALADSSLNGVGTGNPN